MGDGIDTSREGGEEGMSYLVSVVEQEEIGCPYWLSALNRRDQHSRHTHPAVSAD